MITAGHAGGPANRSTFSMITVGHAGESAVIMPIGTELAAADGGSAVIMPTVGTEPCRAAPSCGQTTLARRNSTVRDQASVASASL